MRGPGHRAVVISHDSIVVPFALGLRRRMALPDGGRGDFTGFALFMGAAIDHRLPGAGRILTTPGSTDPNRSAGHHLCRRRRRHSVVHPGGGSRHREPCRGRPTGDRRAGRAVRRRRCSPSSGPLAARVLAGRRGRGRPTPRSCRALIVALFLSAWITEAIGIHAIFGAFMLRWILPLCHLAAQIRERLEDLTVLFLLPVFFAVVGLSTLLGLPVGARAVADCPACRRHRHHRQARRLRWSPRWPPVRPSALDHPRPADERSRDNRDRDSQHRARSLGVISPTLFTIMVLMALFTTFMTTPLLSRLYPRSMVEREILLEHHRERGPR